MADEAVNQQQDDLQVPLSGETQGIILGEMPEPAPLPAESFQPVVAPEASMAPEILLAPEVSATPMPDVVLEPVPVPVEAFQPIPDAAAQSQFQPEAASSTMPQPPVALPDPIQPKTIIVRTGRLVIDVEIHDVRFRYTTPRLSAFASGQYPDLPHHACVNDIGSTFGYVMERTSVPHMLEHLIISEQVRNQSAGADTFAGTTEWLDENAGIARIEVGFKDDLVALRAFNDATRFLNMAVLTCLA